MEMGALAAVMLVFVEFVDVLVVVVESMVCCLRTVTASLTMAAALEADVSLELSKAFVGVNGFMFA